MRDNLLLLKRKRKTRCGSALSGKGKARRSITMLSSSNLKSPGAATIVVWRYSLSNKI